VMVLGRKQFEEWSVADLSLQRLAAVHPRDRTGNSRGHNCERDDPATAEDRHTLGAPKGVWKVLYVRGRSPRRRGARVYAHSAPHPRMSSFIQSALYLEPDTAKNLMVRLYMYGTYT
jgi:hypothetical protein